MLQTIPLADPVCAALRQRYAQPQPRVREAIYLRATGCLSSMIDLSDGLAGDLGHLCKESGVGAQILIDLGLKDIRVVTNHPKKVVALEGYGIRIADQVPLNLTTQKPTHQRL